MNTQTIYYLAHHEQPVYWKIESGNPKAEVIYDWENEPKLTYQIRIGDAFADVLIRNSIHIKASLFEAIKKDILTRYMPRKTVDTLPAPCTS